MQTRTNRLSTATPLFILALFTLTQPLPASQAGIKLKGLELYPTFECIGIRVRYEGDTDSNATAGVRYRLQGSNTWREAQPLARIRDSRFAGSIFFLSPDAVYEVEVALSVPGGEADQKRTAHARTRSDRFPVGGGKEYFVAVSGDSSNPGTLGKPFAAIQQAADLARPGDVVWVMPGVYREEVTVSRSGNRQAYIAFLARGGPVVLSGADPYYESPEPGEKWSAEGNGVFFSDPGRRTRYLAADGDRLYHYLTRKEFDEFICGQPGGWYQDENSGRLYVRLSSGDDPDSHLMQVAALDAGFTVKGADYVLIDGFEVRDYGRQTAGSGVRLDGAAWCVVRNCSIHGMNSKVLLSGARAEGNLVESCELWDTSIHLWPWAMTKGHDEEGAGVMSTGGRGNVVRGCRMHGLFDGLAPSYWDSLWSESYNCDWDVYDNEIFDTRDDIIEPEGPCINFRFWNNYCHNLFVGVSLAPINVGPAYVMYNVVYDQSWMCLKYSGIGPGRCYLYHNTFYSKQPAVHTITCSRPLEAQTFRNNIFFATAYAFWTSKPPKPGNDLDYDTWYTSDTPWFKIWVGTPYKRFFYIDGKEIFFLEDLQRSTGWEMHGKQADPCFVGQESGDLRLRADSPCIDSAELLPNINDSYLGQAPDMGAYERGGSLGSKFPLGKRPR
ncbi:MAG: right-handed parallel beta-helix repeat-containing protein [Candidatus Glassbacteria bacterium]|nr:right-handed parallel beta-helix repeat-containing protein [Candidatus Glassbacteria bacterium]